MLFRSIEGTRPDEALFAPIMTAGLAPKDYHVCFSEDEGANWMAIPSADSRFLTVSGLESDASHPRGAFHHQRFSARAGKAARLEVEVRRDGQPLWLSGSKCRGLYANRKRPAKLSWTQAWRRLHKKDQAREGAGKKKARKRTKFQRSVVGASIEEIRKRKTQTKEVRSAAREMALREVKSRKKAVKKGGKKR